MRKILIHFFLLILFQNLSFSQTNYYVSPSGSDSNNGSINSPWETIQYGLNQLYYGDTLNLETGTYYEKILIPENGIVLRNKLNHSPIIDASGNTSQTAIVKVYDISNFTIDGIELQNNVMLDAQGILIEHNCQNITIENCVIHDIHFSSNTNALVNSTTNAQGIIVYGSDPINPISNLKITNNRLYNCRLGYSEGIAINGNVDEFEVLNNIVHHLTNIGLDFIGFEGVSSNPLTDFARNGLVKNNLIHHCISPYATSGGIYVDGGKSIIIENNICFHNGYGIEVGCENIGKITDSITIRNNVIYDNQVAGLAFGGFDYPTGSGKVTNSNFYNNTLFKNDFSNQGNGEMYLSYTENCKIQNNIFYTSGQNTVLFQDGLPVNLGINYNLYYSDENLSYLTFDYNGIVFMSLSAFKVNTNQDSNSMVANPNFVFPANSSPDFHIQQNSPAINAGNPAYVTFGNEVDIDGEIRVNGIVDCGADEYNAVHQMHEYSSESIRFYPNPSKNIIYLTHQEYLNYEIYSFEGKWVTKGAVVSNQINVSKLSSGHYFIKIEDTKGILRQGKLTITQ